MNNGADGHGHVYHSHSVCSAPGTSLSTHKDLWCGGCYSLYFLEGSLKHRDSHVTEPRFKPTRPFFYISCVIKGYFWGLKVSLPGIYLSFQLAKNHNEQKIYNHSYFCVILKYAAQCNSVVQGLGCPFYSKKLKSGKAVTSPTSYYSLHQVAHLLALLWKRKNDDKCCKQIL